MKKILFYTLTVLITINASAQTLTLKWKTDTTLRVPESVLLHKQQDVLFVANIHGNSREKDGNGFISQLTTDGKIKILEWVTGLDAPKGMGLHQNNLYVADLTRVVIIDISSGKISRTVEVPGAQFLNDVTVDKKGNVYISDSSTGKIHLLKGNTSEVYFESKEFNRINGLLSLEDGLYVADAGNGVNYKLSDDKKLTKFSETSQGADGIVPIGKGQYIVSSWGGEVYLVDAKGKSVKLLDTKAEKLNAADIDYNSKTNMLYVPTFNGNSVMAYEFKR